MHRVFSSRPLRHHSLTCFSKPVAFNRPAILVSTARFPSLAHIHSQPNHPKSTITFSRSTQARSITTTTILSFQGSKMNGINNSAPRAKRKQHPGSIDERPQKQHRAINGKDSAGQNTPEVGMVYEEEELDMEDTRIVPGMADTAEWQACVENVVRNVVSIRFCQTCSFDTDPALTSEATGFVVDAERG